MRFPFTLLPELTDAQLDRYHRHVDSDASGWHRRFTESIWRRHQHPSNARLSGWQGPADKKRRLLHFFDEYGVEGRAFVLRHAYLVMNVTLPRAHVDEYEVRIREGLRTGAWRDVGDGRFVRGDLEARLVRRRLHPMDAARGHAVPAHYENLDVQVKTASFRPPDGWAERPWRVFFDVGLRKTLTRGEPTVLEPEGLTDFFPAQLELGCGPSIEAGIPHLSTLHRIYGVSQADYGFIFRAGHDGLLSLFEDPEAKYREMTEIYRACLVAGTTGFYDTVQRLHRDGHLVGPVITNNFDAQCAVLGLPEVSLRRYDWGPYYPVIDYDRRAKSLLVVGVHADRRLVQMRARARAHRGVRRPRGLRGARRPPHPVPRRGAAARRLLRARDRLRGVRPPRGGALTRAAPGAPGPRRGRTGPGPHPCRMQRGAVRDAVTGRTPARHPRDSPPWHAPRNRRRAMRTRVCLAVALLPSLLVACVPFEPAVELAPPHTGPSAPADCPSGQLGWQCDAATGCTAVCSAPTGGTSSTAAPGREAAMPALPLGAHAREGAVASLQIESIEGAQRRTDVVRGPATVLRYPARQYLFTARTLRTASDGQRPGDLYVFVDRSSAAGSWVRYVETTRAGARVRYTGLGDVRLYVGAAPGELRLGLALSLVPAGANPLAASELRVRGVILGAHGRAGLGETTLGGWCGGVWDLFPAPLTEEALLGPDLDCWDDAGQPVPLCFDTPADEVDVTYDTQQVEPDDGAAPDDGAGVVVPPPPPPIEDDGVGGANVAPPVSDTGDGALLGDDEDDSGVPAGASSTGGSSDTGGSGGDSGGSDSGGSWGGDSGGSDSGGSWGGDSGGGDSGGDW